MTDLLTTDHADSGEIRRPVGETTHRITAAERERIVGEATQNIQPYADGLRPKLRRPDVVDLDDTVIYLPRTIGIVDLEGPQKPPPPLPPIPTPPKQYDLAAAQPVAPWERVVDTERLSLLGSVAGLDGELREAEEPAPLPPLRPAIPLPKPKSRSYRGRHRQVREVSYWRGYAWLAAIVVAAGAVAWWVA